MNRSRVRKVLDPDCVGAGCAGSLPAEALAKAGAKRRRRFSIDWRMIEGDGGARHKAVSSLRFATAVQEGQGPNADSIVDVEAFHFPTQN